MASTSGSKFSSLSPSFARDPPPRDPPPSSIPESFPYDVFLSFRGRDTRNNFTGHLYDRLIMAGIRTFMDDDELQIGREITLQLMSAIEDSRIYIVVFSTNYASSTWCLSELVKIIYQSQKHSGRVLLPVFYGVQPSDVRYQKGTFEKAFGNHEANYTNQLDLVQTWRHSLTRAAYYSGFDLQRNALGSASRLIRLIVEEVLSQVKPKRLFIAKYPVGLDSRINEVFSLLRFESDYPVQSIGIMGMGGSGKTVIAKALYNKILQSFDSSCFLANVREISQQMYGLEHLQEKLISRLLMRDNVKVDNVDEGIEMIRKRLCYKRVLIVIDDADKLSQVDALAGYHGMFGPGSIIIITTRDQHLLNQVQVDGRYEAKELNYEESLELFSWHSFKKGSPLELYAVTADKILSYCCGLPLALEVLGAFLFKRSIQQWNSAFDELRKNPHPDIQKILQISYDGLDYQKREIFLDIACFFVGTDIDYVSEILNGCGFSTEIGIGILKDRCLLTIDMNNKLRMHDLVRDMGRELIWQQCPLNPGKRSRLWSHQDAIKVLMRHEGTKAIEGITLVSPLVEEIHLTTENFARMHSLRLLKMDNVKLDGSFEDLSEEMRWIRWHDCALEHLPSKWKMQNLVVLDMHLSKMKTVWQDFKVLRHLKILDLSQSKCLTTTPDFTCVPSLVTLILEGCTSLVQIDASIGCLRSLFILNIKGCENITYIPSEVCLLKCLGYLNLSGCSNISELPSNLRFNESLKELYADETAITELPFPCLGHLTSLSLRRCTKMTKGDALPTHDYLSLFEGSKTLRRLSLHECNLSDEDIPQNIGNLSGLQEFDLAGNCLSKLPESFRELTNLQSLWLDNWSILQSIPNLPPNLEALLAENIMAYTDTGDLEDHQIQGIVTLYVELPVPGIVESFVDDDDEEAEINSYQIQDEIAPSVEVPVTEIVESFVDDEEETDISSYQIQDKITPNVELPVKERRESLVRKKEKTGISSPCRCL